MFSNISRVFIASTACASFQALGATTSDDVKIAYNVLHDQLFTGNDCAALKSGSFHKTPNSVIRYNTFKNYLGSLSIRFDTEAEAYGLTAAQVSSRFAPSERRATRLVPACTPRSGHAGP